MGFEIKIYKIKDFIRKTESGSIDLEGSKKIVRELAEAAGQHSMPNVLR
jgi:hypothetical protein